MTVRRFNRQRVLAAREQARRGTVTERHAHRDAQVARARRVHAARRALRHLRRER